MEPWLIWSCSLALSHSSSGFGTASRSVRTRRPEGGVDPHLYRDDQDLLGPTPRGCGAQQRAGAAGGDATKCRGQQFGGFGRVGGFERCNASGCGVETIQFFGGFLYVNDHHPPGPSKGCLFIAP